MRSWCPTPAPWGCGAGVGHQERIAQFAGVDDLFHLVVRAVEAAHEPDRGQLAAGQLVLDPGGVGPAHDVRDRCSRCVRSSQWSSCSAVQSRPRPQAARNWRVITALGSGSRGSQGYRSCSQMTYSSLSRPARASTRSFMSGAPAGGRTESPRATASPKGQSFSCDSRVRCTMYSAPTAAWVSAIARKVFSVSAQASALCSMPQPVPATTVKPLSSMTFCNCLASWGKYPYGPVSMYSKPASAISARAFSQGICFSSSGNHTPHWSGHTPIVSLLYVGSVLRALLMTAPCASWVVLGQGRRGP